ncbi:methyltransferase [Ancylobacter amanitiformis]|uniref:Methyltransferase small domain-containing protein n=1 Tax=Ancylobacter amanitiformis TaxID=217069 RepID=A0ABU0LQG4_9HYPH|nr:methyltransferase [Ancylobacter amanitiformis]MDQ0510903.1 hypothetical protein [Ancylobacter amanitiformis]
MAKLTKSQAKHHAAAVDLLRKDRLTDDQREFVLRNWREDANHVNGTAGAFFTPLDLALDFTIEVNGRRIIDLCAGIGCLALACHWRNGWNEPPREIVCIEKNPDYVAVGRKLLPEAQWICADIFELPFLAADLGRFDIAISNPPFGAVRRAGRNGPRYRGNAFEYHVIDLAADVADAGTFIIPQSSAPFRYSGRPCFERREEPGYLDFKKATGITLQHNCGMDCNVHKDGWRGVSPTVEIVLADFTNGRKD